MEEAGLGLFCSASPQQVTAQHLLSPGAIRVVHRLRTVESLGETWGPVGARCRPRGSCLREPEARWSAGTQVPKRPSGRKRSHGQCGRDRRGRDTGVGSGRTKRLTSLQGHSRDGPAGTEHGPQEEECLLHAWRPLPGPQDSTENAQLICIGSGSGGGS